jgi:raffinose/stachyose/melibiose transport system permease protein
VISASYTLGRDRQRSTRVTAVLLLAPAFFFIVVFLLVSIFNSIQLSAFDWNGADAVKEFVGLANWGALWGDERFGLALLNNLRIVAFSIATQLPIGMALALLLYKGGGRVTLLKVVYFLPMLMSSVAIGFLFRSIFDPEFGLFAPLARALSGTSPDFLGDPKIAIYSVIFVICWQFTPFYMIYFLAGLNTLPEDVHEAAIIDGASESRYFFSFALPMMRGILYNAIVMSMVGSLKYFDLVYVMTEGGPSGSTELMATYMYKNAFTIMKMGYGSTIATAMFAIVTAASLGTLWALKRNGRGESYE